MQTRGTFVFGWEVDAFTKNGHVIASENFVLFLSVLLCCIIAQHCSRDVWIIKSVPESLVTITISAIVSGILCLTIESKEYFSPLVIGFSPEVFYFGLLPPIIFSSSYHLKRKLLYGNLGAVLLLAFVGTCATAAITTIGILSLQSVLPGSPRMAAIESVAFACVVAANDPVSTLAIFSGLKVSPSLYYAVLGESVLNDAVAITAFKVASRMIGASAFTMMDVATCTVNFCVLVLGSTTIGYIFAVIVAFILRHIDFGRNKVAPIAVVICAMYIPFFLTEMLQLSGIVTVFFSGVAARR
jgi:NhaP-type Na+/H+ or K+/H+ antiporter